jgi:hypothetical protein
MSDQPLSASATDAFQTYVREQARATRLRRSRGKARDETGLMPTAHPLQFDARGFPVAQPNGGGLTHRIRRLLAASR